MSSIRDYLGETLDRRFAVLGLRLYKIRYEGQKGNLLPTPVLIDPTPHISDLNVSSLDRPNFSHSPSRTFQEADNYAVRQYSVKFSRSVMQRIAQSLSVPLIQLFTRNARYGILRPFDSTWLTYKPLSEPTEELNLGHFISIVLQPEKGPY